MKLGARDYLALGVAGIADLIDYAGGAIPYLGEPLDILAPTIYGYLLKDARALIGMSEAASIFPPAALLDFVPIHTMTVLYILNDKKKRR